MSPSSCYENNARIVGYEYTHTTSYSPTVSIQLAPVISLSNKATITSGTGSEDDPWIIK